MPPGPSAMGEGRKFQSHAPTISASRGAVPFISTEKLRKRARVARRSEMHNACCVSSGYIGMVKSIISAIATPISRTFVAFKIKCKIKYALKADDNLMPPLSFERVSKIAKYQVYNSAT